MRYEEDQNPVSDLLRNPTLVPFITYGLVFGFTLLAFAHFFKRLAAGAVDYGCWWINPHDVVVLLAECLVKSTNKELASYTSTITLFFRTTMNRKKGSSIQIDICLPPNATPQSESMKKSTKDHNGKVTVPMRKLIMEVWEFTREDTDRVTFSLKVGLACLLVSLHILIQAPYQVFGTNFILEKDGMKK
ncbi:hypothetical protein ZIOFF_055640 [Zingiber officinale]|uniref:Uncharacterized protein n=1 Tax=Zingiber officinale TaxID=94328 RepID=A0A8J5FJH5_ZINOF|nr:hypothetical protein ZIOFF_055640 [Zingiber officinale]